MIYNQTEQIVHLIVNNGHNPEKTFTLSPNSLKYVDLTYEFLPGSIATAFSTPDSIEGTCTIYTEKMIERHVNTIDITNTYRMATSYSNVIIIIQTK
jgi:hypothetical protein